MEHNPKALSPATQPVAQPAPAVQKPKKPKQTKTLADILETPPPADLLVSKADAVADAVAVAEWKLLKAQAQAKAEGNALADAQAQNEQEFAKSQRAMRRQPKHIQALGRQLWKLWG